MHFLNIILLFACLSDVLASPVAKTKTKSVKTTTTKKSTTQKTTTTTKPVTTTTTTKPSTTTTSKPSTTTSETSTTTVPSTTTSKPSTTTQPSTTTSTPVSTTTPIPSTTTTTPSTTLKVTPTATPVVSTGKRGLGFNDPALTDYFSLAGQDSKVSWAYNWASDPYYPSGWTPNSFNAVLKYTPMLWSAADDLTSIWTANVQNAISTHKTDAVLSFNEPDGCCWSCGNSCMNVSAAVSAYQQWVQPWAGKVLLGSPAVTNGVGSGVGIDYMKQFMSNCTSCTVDFIPIHWYGSVLDPASFQTYVQSFWTQFGKPIWITEFGTTSGTEAQIVSFLQTVLPWLDQQSYVQRYAYFMDTNQGSPYLLETNNSMTDIGVVYNSG